MLVLGLLLLGATGVFIGLLVADNTDGPMYHVTVLGQGIATLNGLAVFLAGIALTLILGLALLMIKAGVASARRRRQLLRDGRRPAPPATHEPYPPNGRGEFHERRPDAPQDQRSDGDADLGRGGDEAPARTRRSRRRLRFGH
ncbi:hypothetical protein AB0953_22810 [Streptomyces sp. NPDC046866]|uniref:hypothetical protein n=1 Tax=Streptomyces sp. NPDC046866 TaxID=3154921 RepID=UPI003456B83F